MEYNESKPYIYQSYNYGDFLKNEEGGYGYETTNNKQVNMNSLKSSNNN